MELKNKSQSLNSIKVYALLLVVLGHVLAIYSPNSSFPHDGKWFIGVLYNIIYSFHMPLFLSVSGAVYAICRDSNKYGTWRSLMNSKIKRVLVPYLTFSILVLFPVLEWLGLTDINIIGFVKNVLVGKDIRHLWYLYVLFVMYVVTYTIEGLLLKTKNMYVVLFCVLCLSIAAEKFIKIDIFQLNMFLRYYVFYIVGYYIGKGFLTLHYNLIMDISFVIIGIIGCWLMFQLPPFIYSIVTRLVAIVFILAAYSICYKYKLASGTKVYDWIKRDGMGIYLFHVIIIYIFYYFDAFAECGLYVQIFLALIISLVGSIVCTRLVRMLHFNFLIGESERNKRYVKRTEV